MIKRRRLKQAIQTIIMKNSENDDEKSLFYAFDKSVQLMLFQSLNYFKL